MNTQELNLLKQQLLDAIFENPATAFPEFEWIANNKNPKYGLYTSPLHLTGLREPRDYCSHQTRIEDGANDKHCTFLDHNGDSIEILSYWREKSGERFPNCPKLFALYNIEAPQQDPEQEKKRIQRKTDTEKLLDTIRADYLGSKGKAVREYLAKSLREGGRGYDDATISAMADFMGVITPQTAKQLSNLTGLHFPTNIAETHPIVILTRSKRTGEIQYAKFRTIDPTATGGNKWRNPTKGEQGTGRDDVEPFNYNNTKFVGADGCSSVVVVESEICSAHATICGIKNVIALRGSDGIKPQLIRRLTNDYCKNIVLLLDSDEKGVEATKKAIKQIQQATNKISVAVAHIPDDVRTKDPDELLSKYESGAQMLQQYIDDALLSTEWEAQLYIDQYKRAETNTERNKIEADVLQHVIELRECKQEFQADKLSTIFCDASGVKFTADTLISVSQREAQEKGIEQYKKNIKKAFETLSTAIASEDIKAINDARLDLVDIRKPNNDPYLRLDNTKEFGDIFSKLYRNAERDIETTYKLYTRSYDNTIIETPLTLYGNGITYFAGGTSHGKSTFLQNIAIDILDPDPADETRKPKRVLYYGFEEAIADTILELANIYIHKHTGNVYYDLSRSGSTSAINKFFKDQDPEVFDLVPTPEERKRVAECIYGFFHNFFGADKGENKLYIYDDALTSAELVQHIEERIEILRPDAIFVDYVQYLQSEDNVKKAQWEDLGEVSKDLIHINKMTGVPMVVAAQLQEKNNPKITKPNSTPDELRYTDIQGASTIAQGASAVYLIANSTKYSEESVVNYFKPKGTYKIDGKDVPLPQTPFGQRGLMYIKLDKNRFGSCPAYALFQYNGAQRFINPKTLVPHGQENENRNGQQPEIYRQPENNDLPF